MQHSEHGIILGISFIVTAARRVAFFTPARLKIVFLNFSKRSRSQLAL